MFEEPGPCTVVTYSEFWPHNLNPGQEGVDLAMTLHRKESNKELQYNPVSTTQYNLHTTCFVFGELLTLHASSLDSLTKQQHHIDTLDKNNTGTQIE